MGVAMLSGMHTVIAGGSGFLGSALAHALAAEGHQVSILTRGRPAGPARVRGASLVQWTPDGTAGPWRSVIDGATAVVNLAGESIAARRWSPAQKQKLRDSRILAT